LLQISPAAQSASVVHSSAGTTQVPLLQTSPAAQSASVAHSSQVLVVSLQTWSAVQGSSPFVQTLPEQVSAPLQNVESSQSALVTHSTHSPFDEAGLHTKPFEQVTGSCVQTATAPFESVPFEHTSVVQALLSSQAAVLLQGPWVPQPDSRPINATTASPLHRTTQCRPFVH
jgi:hypothetical protein